MGASCPVHRQLAPDSGFAGRTANAVPLCRLAGKRTWQLPDRGRCGGGCSCPARSAPIARREDHQERKIAPVATGLDARWRRGLRLARRSGGRRHGRPHDRLRGCDCISIRSKIRGARSGRPRIYSSDLPARRRSVPASAPGYQRSVLPRSDELPGNLLLATHGFLIEPIMVRSTTIARRPPGVFSRELAS